MSKTDCDEVKTRLDGSSETWRCEVLALEPGRRAVLRYVLDRDREVGASGLVLRSGTVTIAHYWSDRPFNVYHWTLGPTTVAYYANVAESLEISPTRVAYLDLAIDVLVRPSGAVDILDEDEVPVDLQPGHRKTIADALEQITANPRGLIKEIEDASRPFR